MGFFIAILVIAGSIGLLILISKHDNKKIDKSKENIPNVIDTYKDMRYLGGHPLVEVNEIKKGVLLICSDKIIYLNNLDSVLNSLNPVFEISIDSINLSAIETKESLTVTRMLLVGILAFALKKNEKYVRVEYMDELGNIHNVIFAPVLNSLAPQIAARINQTKLDFRNNIQ